MKYLLISSLIIGASTATLPSTSIAQVVSSEQVMHTQVAHYNKQKLIQVVSREDMQEKLFALGVNHTDAVNRINAMTDSEVAELNAQLSEQKAGGIVGAVITILAFLAITDLIGVTDVYPFIKPINN